MIRTACQSRPGEGVDKLNKFLQKIFGRDAAAGIQLLCGKEGARLQVPVEKHVP